ncbi:hypothetical protein TNCT_41251 [Trichonephila clavata]|uniref:Secreted protein n=1 Tax=Trichonephila clavata TaxID=2740835 RepID=A0A8X6KA79_TRICU|nr:hypothetical protein TNCT_41251 [Trichonephila clavata]
MATVLRFLFLSFPAVSLASRVELRGREERVLLIRPSDGRDSKLPSDVPEPEDLAQSVGSLTRLHNTNHISGKRSVNCRNRIGRRIP